MLFLGRNDEKKTKSLRETIDNLSTQIDQYQSINNEQSEAMKVLKSQLEAYLSASDDDKRLLRERIQALRNDLSAARNNSGGDDCTIL